MKNSKCATSKQKNQNGRPSRYKEKHEQKKTPRRERAEIRARDRKMPKNMKNCKKVEKCQQTDYRNVVPSPWEANYTDESESEAKHG